MPDENHLKPAGVLQLCPSVAIIGNLTQNSVLESHRKLELDFNAGQSPKETYSEIEMGIQKKNLENHAGSTRLETRWNRGKIWNETLSQQWGETKATKGSEDSVILQSSPTQQ